MDLKSINTFYDRINKKDLIEFLYEKNDDDFDRITSVNFPIFYLFDHTINDKIGSTHIKRHYLRRKLELDNLFSLTSTNIYDIGVDSHSTILYKFEYNNRKYIYYSNSGLGINNQLCRNKTTSCKIFYIKDDILWNNLSNYIMKIIEQVKDVTSYDTEEDSSGKIETEEIWKKLIVDVSNTINKEEYDIIIKFIINYEVKKKHKEQNLCYALLNLYCSRNDSISECSINHLLYGDDHELYKNKIKDIFISKDLKILIDNCYNQYNENIYNQIIDIPENKEDNEFHKFIKDINIELDILKIIPTIKYKLENSFKLVYNNISGLYNNEQQSGSCSLYSYYNLALNMKILNIFNTTKSVQTIIETFVDFHYKMIYLFCLSNDTMYTPVKIYKYCKENLYNIQYINRLIKENNLLDEIVEFYPAETFLLNPKRLFIDKLLDYKIEGTLIRRDILKKIPNDDIFKDWFDYLAETIYKIRNKLFNKTLKEMSIEIRTIFIKIIETINTTENIYKYNTVSHRDYESINFVEVYYNTIAEIWTIYLVYLYEIYQEKVDIQTERNNQEKYFILEFYIPELVVDKSKWYRFNPNIDRRSEHIYIQNYTNYYNLRSSDYLFFYLNFNEIVNISDKINDKTSVTGFIDNIISKYKIEFNFCNFYIINSVEVKYRFCRNYHDMVNIQLYSSSYEILINLYFEIKHKIRNKYIDEKIRDVYKLYIKSIINNIKKYIRFLDSKYKSAFNEYINNSMDIKPIILILTDSKLLLGDLGHSNKFDGYRSIELFSYSYKISSETQIYHGQYDKEYNSKILNYLMDDNNDDIDYKINKIMEMVSNRINTIKWIEKLDFIIPTDIQNDPFIYDSREYFSFIYKYNDQNSHAIDTILYRFGFNFRDIEDYLFLYPKSDTYGKKRSLDRLELYDISPVNEKCFILINKYKKCIEITFKDGFINQTECYLFDETNKDTKNKLLFNLKKETHPFILLIPENMPYLCYERDNHFYFDSILSSTISKGYNGSELYKEEITNFNFEFSMYKLKIAPSLIFSTIISYNSEYHNRLFEFYDVSKLNITSKVDILKQKYNITNDYTVLNKIIDDLYIKICSTISCDTKIDISKFKEVLDMLPPPDTNRERVFNSFYSEHRIVDFKCIPNCITEITKYNPILDAIKSNIIKEIKTDKKIDNFIFNNMNIWLLLMEVNILINLVNDIKLDTKSGDIQDKLTSLKSIKYFNTKIKESFYYGFEILFLLQNEYFFKESQMDKYDEIRKDLISKEDSIEHTELKLHQFMMGKGKTSVMTPLLSFAIKLLKGKQPTIITIDHLIKPTRKYTTFIESITNIRVNIFSDFQAKKRWLEHTDQQLIKDIKEEADDIKIALLEDTNVERKKELEERLDEIENTNLNNEMNIIDEFDSHHNYLQSMFNSIKNKKSISKDLFRYIFDFTFNKIKGIPIKEYESLDEFIKNKQILNDNLEYFYKQSENMIYNKEYGFAFTIYKDFNQISRICTPFTRKDTPVKNSKFSNLLLTLILTFKEYITKYDCKLNNDVLYDYKNILNNKTLLHNIISILDISKDKKQQINAILIEDFLDIQIITRIIKDDIYREIDSNIKLKNDILVMYLYNVNQAEINITTDQYNMSFQDIIYNNYNQWQVGYTGTASLELNTYDSIDKVPFVFRKKIPDYDEIIEIKLALEGYGKKDYDNKVILIDKKSSYKENINNIIELLKDDPRGFVDLVGIFLEYDNKEIANELYKKLTKEKKIVYFEDDDEAYEFTESSEKIKYKESDKDNFYYYDQCHTVGSDLKQSFNGHIAIIINKNTRYTDFAQAIFRFRKLNRGTYLSVIYIYEDDSEKELYKTNDKIYELLNNNEIEFNKNQNNGLKYQLLKAMIRKDSKQYQEVNLEPEFMREIKFNKESSITYMKNIIKTPTPWSNYLDSNSFIKKIYDKMTMLNDDELIKLIIGIGTQIQKQEEEEQEEEMDKEKEKEKEKDKIINYEKLNSKIEKFKITSINHIKSFNCEVCNICNFIKLFESSDIKINNKDIYISFNIFNDVDDYPLIITNYEELSIWNEENIFDRFHYVEFNDKIVIETERVVLDYYINKLPVYNHEGKLLVPNMCNNSNDGMNLRILDIDIRFIKMMGIKNYINPNDIEYEEIDIQSVVDNLTPYGLVLLSFHLAHNKFRNRYNLSTELQNRINEFKITEIPDSSDFKIDWTSISPQKTFFDHYHHPLYYLYDVYFDIYNYKLKLNADGYEGEPNRIYYNNIYNYRSKKQGITPNRSLYMKRRKELEVFQKYKIQYEKKTTILAPLIKKQIKDSNKFKYIKDLILELLRISNNISKIENKLESLQYLSIKRKINKLI